MDLQECRFSSSLGMIEFWVMSFMNLIMGFFGVPWFLFSTKQFGLRFAFSAFVFLGCVFSLKKT